MKVQVIASLAAFFVSSFSYSQTRNPIGEQAYYKLDRSSSRTSNVITDGKFNAEVMGINSAEDAYKVDLDYKLKIKLVGTQKGTEKIEAPTEYFSEQFLVDLRENGHYESPQFKIKHRGFKDAINSDGAEYDHCDILLIYDIDSKHFDFVRQALKKMAVASLKQNGLAVDSNAGIDDLEIVAHIQYGVPVLGAVKLDVKGKYQGMSLKAGADYVAP